MPGEQLRPQVDPLLLGAFLEGELVAGPELGDGVVLVVAELADLVQPPPILLSGSRLRVRPICVSVSLSLSLSHTHKHTHTLSLSYTHTQKHTHTHLPDLVQPPRVLLSGLRFQVEVLGIRD